MTADGRDRRDMSTAEYHAEIRERDADKSNTDYPPLWVTYRHFYREQWPPGLRFDMVVSISCVIARVGHYPGAERSQGRTK
jgi:hypothetical protein